MDQLKWTILVLYYMLMDSQKWQVERYKNVISTEIQKLQEFLLITSVYHDQIPIMTSSILSLKKINITFFLISTFFACYDVCFPSVARFLYPNPLSTRPTVIVVPQSELVANTQVKIGNNVQLCYFVVWSVGLRRLMLYIVQGVCYIFLIALLIRTRVTRFFKHESIVFLIIA